MPDTGNRAVLRVYGRIVAHLAAAFIALVAYVAVTFLDPHTVRVVLVFVLAGNVAAAVVTYFRGPKRDAER